MMLNEDHIKKISRGDTKSFKEIYDDMFHSLCLYAYNILPEKNAVNDIVQEAFIALWNKRSQLNTLLGAKSYLYTVVRNNTIRELRARKKISAEEIDLLEQTATIDYQITKEETFKLVNRAIASLPKQTQEVVKLTMAGLTNPLIAQEMSISVNTVKTLKKAGYKKLHHQLKDVFFLLLFISSITR